MGRTPKQPESRRWVGRTTDQKDTCGLCRTSGEQDGRAGLGGQPTKRCPWGEQNPKRTKKEQGLLERLTRRGSGSFGWVKTQKNRKAQPERDLGVGKNAE